MIQLPENYLDSAYVDNLKGIIFLHFKNSSDQYFTYRYYLDKAFSFGDHLDKLEYNVRHMLTENAYVLRDDLSMEFVQPTSQDWKPSPMIGDSIISFVQYKAHSHLAHSEDQNAAQ